MGQCHNKQLQCLVDGGHCRHRSLVRQTQFNLDQHKFPS
jgi:hypothetical protein